jgi:hypothetical protein
VTTVVESVTVSTVTVTVVTDHVPITSTASSLLSSALSASASQTLSSTTPSASTIDTVSTTSISSSADPTPMPQSSINALTSTAESSSVLPVPTSDVVPPNNFCLKVLTPNVKSSGWVIKQSDPSGSNGALWIDPIVGGQYNYIVRFSIGADNVLFLNLPGGGTKITRYSRGTSGMFRFSDPFQQSNTCVVKTSVPGFEGQQVLKCTGGFTTKPIHTYTGFRDQPVNNNGKHYLFGNDDFEKPDTEENFKIELGLFTGGDCPVDAPAPSTTSEETLPSSATPTLSSDALSTNSSGTATPTPA